MKALVLEKALVGAFSVIVKTLWTFVAISIYDVTIVGTNSSRPLLEPD